MLHLLAALVVSSLCVSTVLAQRSRKSQAGPRAMGLLEVTPNGRARLIPITILVNGRFYDASAYQARPLPMALEPETIYEGARSGDPVGLFTITNAVSVAKNWYGLGQWKTHAAAEAEKAPKPSVSAQTPVDEDARPILRRPRAEPTAEPKPVESAPAPKPEAKAEAKPAPQPALPAPQEDSDRPVLRRGKPAQEQTSDDMSVFTPKPGARPGERTSTPMEIYTAISDADGPRPRSFVMKLEAAEQKKHEEAVRTLAYDAVRRFVSGRGQRKLAPITALTVTQFKAFDMSNNEPLLVMTAELPELSPAGTATSLRYYITVAARVDMYGDLRRLFADVTDTSHLDVYPRMELIDAVDAEGSGSGQLLFRRISDSGYSYALYRVGADRLWPLFTSVAQPF